MSATPHTTRRTIAGIHGISDRDLLGGGFLVHRTPTGRKVAISTRTRDLLRGVAK